MSTPIYASITRQLKDTLVGPDFPYIEDPKTGKPVLNKKVSKNKGDVVKYLLNNGFKKERQGNFYVFYKDSPVEKIAVELKTKPVSKLLEKEVINEVLAQPTESVAIKRRKVVMNPRPRTEEVMDFEEDINEFKLKKLQDDNAIEMMRQQAETMRKTRQDEELHREKLREAELMILEKEASEQRQALEEKANSEELPGFQPVQGITRPITMAEPQATEDIVTEELLGIRKKIDDVETATVSGPKVLAQESAQVDVNMDEPGPDQGTASEPDTDPSEPETVSDAEQPKEVIKQVPDIPLAKTKFKPKYHLDSILLFFGSIENPNWDGILQDNISGMKNPKNEIKEYCQTIVKEFGPKLLIARIKSEGDLVELNELMQLEQFYIAGLIRRGTYAMMKVADLVKFNRDLAPKENNTYQRRNATTSENIDGVPDSAEDLAQGSQAQGSQSSGTNSSVSQPIPSNVKAVPNITTTQNDIDTLVLQTARENPYTDRGKLKVGSDLAASLVQSQPIPIFRTTDRDINRGDPVLRAAKIKHY